MPLPSANTWLTRPGGWDVLNARRLYDGDARYGIPTVLPTAIGPNVPDRFTAWPARKHRPESSGLHFFVDDYRFEAVWRNPWRYEATLTRVPLVLSPDFSIFADWPHAMQIWQVYRARWLCRAIQDMGARAVSAVTWGDAKSYSFAFAGLPSGVPVAVTSVGRGRSATGWDAGYRAMVSQVRPSRVFVCGPALPCDIDALAPTTTFRSEALTRVRGLDGRQG